MHLTEQGLRPDDHHPVPAHDDRRQLPLARMQIPPEIDPTLSVNDVLRRWPFAVRTLNQYAIDTCCGGALSLADAARDAGVAVDELIAAISVDATEVAATGREGQ